MYLHNRTYENAVEVANHFNAWCEAEGRTGKSPRVRALITGEIQWPQDSDLPIVIVASVPTTTASFSGRPGETFKLPKEWLDSPSGGVAADVSYNPPNTPFLEQIKDLRSASGRSWAVVDGVELVYEQAILQFEQMTGYRAPRAAMKKGLKG